MGNRISTVEKHFRSIATNDAASIRARVRALQQMAGSTRFLTAFLKTPDLHPRLELAATELLARLRDEAAEAVEKRVQDEKLKTVFDALR